MKNKVCIVLPCNIHAAPYYYKYEKILKELNVNFDLIIWNREQIREETSANIISFNVKDIPNSGEKKKIINYFKFSFFVKKRLKEVKYQKVIFLSTSAATVALLSVFLKKRYKDKFWIDIRDYSFEWFLPYKQALSIAINNSYLTTISSKGFEEFLPKYDYLVTHNVDLPTINKVIERKRNELTKLDHESIKISFIGNIRYFNENTKILNIFKNDKRFTLQYFGTQSELLQEYCEQNGIENVKFKGRFNPEETWFYYMKTDIINNVYGNDSMELTTALSNKLYYAAGLNIPILVSPNTYMQTVSEKYNLGYTFNTDDINMNDKLYDWYINREKSEGEIFMKSVLIDYTDFEREIRGFIRFEG